MEGHTGKSRGIVFIHIPKTAGTSFRSMLSAGFGDGNVSPSFRASRLTLADANALDRFRVISGHISIEDVDRFFADRDLITVMRQPVDRCLSWYYFARQHRGASEHIDVQAAQRFEPEEFFQSGQYVTFRNVFNRQVRQLGGHVMDYFPDLDVALNAARETLKRCVWVGRQETLAADVLRLARLYPELRECTLPIYNVTAGRKRSSDLSTELLRSIYDHNRFDFRLFNGESFDAAGA